MRLGLLATVVALALATTAGLANAQTPAVGLPIPSPVAADAAATGITTLGDTIVPMPGTLGDLVLSANSGPPALVTIRGTEGAFPDAPVPANDEAPLPPSAPTTVVASVRFSFDHDVTFEGLPSFEFDKRFGGLPPSGPFALELFDETAHVRLAVLASMEHGNVTFLGRYTAAFAAKRSHSYVAELVRAPIVAYHALKNAPETAFALPTAGGISATLDLPGGTGEEHGPSAILVAGTSVPPGMPPLSGGRVRAVRYVAQAVVTGTENYDGPVTATFTLPSGRAGANLGLAVFDPGYPTRGWTVLPVNPTSAGPNAVRFTMPSAMFRLMWRPYGLALFEGTEPASTLAAQSAAASPGSFHRAYTVVMVGSSTLFLTVTPFGTTFPCPGGWTPIPDCQFSSDPRENIGGVTARLLGGRARVINLAWLGSQTTAETWIGPSMLVQQVPQIPSDADVVVLDEGQNDLGFNGHKPETATRVDEMTTAIHAKAPRAKIVYLGLRCFIGCVPESVAAWNAVEQKDAAIYGAWVDMAQFGPSGPNASFPDGGHPSPAVAEAVGTALANVIRPWMAAAGNR